MEVNQGTRATFFEAGIAVDDGREEQPDSSGTVLCST